MRYWHGYSDPIIMIICYVPLFFNGPVYSFRSGPNSPLPKKYSEGTIVILSFVIGALLAAIGTVIFLRFDAKPFWWAPILILVPLMLLKLLYSVVSNWYGED
jgi:hypothetical protein